jgi:glycosyltransferase involved in cell wall biosynthesis
MPVEVLPLSVVIPTRDRAAALRRTLESLAAQSAQPVELIIVDASDDSLTRALCLDPSISGLASTLHWHRAEIAGAASQRNEGVRHCSQPVIGFFDDDILFEPECVARLWRALHSHPSIGGVNAMITNQRYQAGAISRLIFCLMAGRSESSYAGRVLGPAVNLLPEDRDELPEVVPIDWLNLGCTLYRGEALPNPPFSAHFNGYSAMEDLTLSLTVGKHWKLANARTARIYHDSQPGTHKSDTAEVAAMQLFNRHYVMKEVLGRSRLRDYLKLAIWLAFSHASLLGQAGQWRTQIARMRGEWRAITAILAGEGFVTQ